MAEEKKGLPTLDLMGTYFSQQEVKGAEKTEQAIKQFSKDLQIAIKSNGMMIGAQTSVLLEIKEVLSNAFNIDEERLELIKEQMRIAAEERLENARKKDLLDNKKVKRDGSDQSWLLPLLGIGGLASAFVAITASITGLDAALKAVNLPNTFKAIKAPFKGIGDYFDKIRNMEKPKIPDMPKVTFVDAEGKPYDFKKFNIGVPDGQLTIGQKISNAFKMMRFNIFGAFGLTPDGLPIKDPETGRLTSGKPVSTQIAERFNGLLTRLKDIFIFGEGNGTIFSAASEIKQSIIDTFNKIPRIDIELPQWVYDVPKNIGKLIGSAEEGTGVLGFFSKAFGFLEPVLKPLKMVIGTIFRPFTQILLTVVDFVVGFYEGFTGTEGSLMDKLGAGLEGGLKGIIKGITEAIDLIFIQFPAWILGKLGFEDTANELKEFSLTSLVDPIWDSIKKFFTTLISGDISGAAGMLVGGVEDFFKAILRAVLPDPTADYAFLDPRNALQKLFSAMGTYEYAGINVDTGELINPPQPTVVSEAVQPVDEFSAVEIDQRSRDLSASASSPIVQVTAPQTTVEGDRSVRQNSVTVTPASPRRGRGPVGYGSYQDPLWVG